MNLNLVRHFLEQAQKRLAVLRPEAPLSAAAEILASPNTPLVVVCDNDGFAIGVVSSTDILKALACGRRDAFDASAGAIMSAPIQSCSVNQSMQSVWEAMGTLRLRSLPVLDADGRPKGIVHARDVASALLAEVTYEEVLLRDYVLGIGYQ